MINSYKKTTWKDYESVVAADSLNNIEDGLSAVTDEAIKTSNKVAILDKQMGNLNVASANIDNIVLDVANGYAEEKYPVGTQLITSWDRVAADGTKTHYEPELNIVHYEKVSVKDKESDSSDRTSNVMYLEWDKTIPDGIALCIPQALQCFDGTGGAPDGLPAGTYCIKMKAPNGGTTYRTRWNGKYVKFTLSKAIPAGGILKLNCSDWNGTSDSAIAIHFITYNGDAENSAKIEEVSVSTASDAQPSGTKYLGEVWGSDVGYGQLNHPEACYYGDNTWANSDLRQWLNGDGKDWWTKKTRYNRKPNSVNSLQGYLTGLDTELKNNMKLIKNTTIGSNIKYPNQKFITYDKVFLHSFNQSNITTAHSAQFDNEGLRWDYYKKLASGVSNLDSAGRFRIWQTYPILIRYAINATTSAQYVFSRSARLGYACNVYGVYASGDCSDTTASNGGRCLPACVISG